MSNKKFQVLSHSREHYDAIIKRGIQLGYKPILGMKDFKSNGFIYFYEDEITSGHIKEYILPIKTLDDLYLMKPIKNIYIREHLVEFKKQGFIVASIFIPWEQLDMLLKEKERLNI